MSCTLSRWFLRVCLLLIPLALAGCGRSDNKDEHADDRNPYMRRAKERASEKDYAAAIQFYKRALADNPELARAHLELGILYDETKNYVGAIYHYDAYLELRPNVDANHRKWLEDSIRHAKYSLVTEMPVNAGTRKTMEDLGLKVEELRTQNAKLIEIIRQMQKQASAGGKITVPDLSALEPKIRGSIPGSQVSAPVPTASPARPPVPPEYKVVAGDTLTAISEKVYGDPRQWKKIQEANAGLPLDRLKPGQILKIPQ